MPAKDPEYEQRVQDAMQSYKSGMSESIRAAADSHGVVYSTLQ